MAGEPAGLPAGRLTVATSINAHKILVVPVVLGLMWYFDNWSAVAYTYLGEILIYAGYATLSCHRLPFLVLAGWVFDFFLRNTLAKDRSMSRYTEFAASKRRTGLLLPRLW